MKRIFKTLTGAAGVALLAAFTAFPAAAAPPLPAADEVAPGIGIVPVNASGGGEGACSVGFLVHTSAGKPGFLTAGHCDHGATASYKNAVGTYESIGAFSQSVDVEDGIDDSDIGLVEFTSAAPTDSAIYGFRPVTGVASTTRLAIGDQLCKFGVATGRQCGKVTYVTPTKVFFEAKTDVGDSGGPVYYRNADGTATAVGITIRTDDAGSVAEAELIEPWLAKWNLTLDKAPMAPVPLPAAYRPNR